MKITPARLLVLLLLAASALGETRARAQSPQAAPEPARADDEIIIVHSARPEGLYDLNSPAPRAAGAERALGEPGFLTEVRVAERAGESATVASVLAQSVGARVQSLGGLGSFASLSVRGAAPGHTAVLIDGVPLSKMASVTSDLGRFELDSFERLELYRGGVPVEYGGAALGGALNLVTRIGPSQAGRPLRFSLGGGSFGARHASARWLGGRDDGSRGHQLAVNYSGAEGDYRYFHDNGTNLNLDDDSEQRRQNNGYDQVEGVGRVRFVRGDAELALGSRALWKQQGIPGSANLQALHASLETITYVADASARFSNAFGVDALSAGATAFGMIEYQRYRDRDGEVGIAPQDRRYLTLSGGGSGFVRKPLGNYNRVAAGVEARVDHFTDHDFTPSEPLPRSYGDRIGVAFTAADEIEVGPGGMILLLPAVRLDVQHTIPASDVSTGVSNGMPLPDHTEVYPSPRLSARVRVSDGVAVKGSAGRFFRAPTALELFGDRGFVVGNSDLRAESGESADLGVVVAPDRAFGPVDRFYGEVAVFAAAAHDTIAFSTGSGLVSRAQNIGESVTSGIELTASTRLAHAVTLTGNYSFLDSRQGKHLFAYDGRRVPLRPAHEIYGRIDAAQTYWQRLFVVWVDGTVTGENQLDVANIRRAPQRRFVGAGLKAEIVPGLLLGVEGRNLTDQRVEQEELASPPRPDLTQVPRAVSDFAGYPLPGRAFYLTLEWEPVL